MHKPYHSISIMIYSNIYEYTVHNNLNLLKLFITKSGGGGGGLKPPMPPGSTVPIIKGVPCVNHTGPVIIYSRINNPHLIITSWWHLQARGTKYTCVELLHNLHLNTSTLRCSGKLILSIRVY